MLLYFQKKVSSKLNFRKNNKHLLKHPKTLVILHVCVNHINILFVQKNLNQYFMFRKKFRSSNALCIKKRSKDINR